MADNKVKIQFNLDEAIANLIEQIRKRFYSSTSKQYLFEKIMTEWATFQSRKL